MWLLKDFSSLCLAFNKARDSMQTLISYMQNLLYWLVGVVSVDVAVIATAFIERKKTTTFQSHFIYICISTKVACINDEIKANSLYYSFGFFDDEYFRWKRRFALHTLIPHTAVYTTAFFMKMEFSSFFYHGFNDILHMLYVIFRLCVLFVEKCFIFSCALLFH